jgi:hypothetical protein
MGEEYPARIWSDGAAADLPTGHWAPEQYLASKVR